MKITIAYLYYNLLNLYGENGNIKIIKKSLENQGINVVVKFLDLKDKLEFEKYDLIYMGSGTSEMTEVIIKELLKYKNEIVKFIEKKKFFIVTGNSLDMFGKYILKNNNKIKCLNIFDFFVKIEEINFSDKSLFKTKLIDEEIIGFQKRNTLMFNNKYSFFEVIDGLGENLLENKEGVHYKNFFGTYLIGPFLIKNPYFLIYLLKKLILSKNQNFQFKVFELNLEKQAYINYLNYNYGIIKSE